MYTQPKNVIKLGTYLRDCDVCGFTYFRNQLRERYDGAIVCRLDWVDNPEDKKVKFYKSIPFKGD